MLVSLGAPFRIMGAMRRRHIGLGFLIAALILVAGVWFGTAMFNQPEYILVPVDYNPFPDELDV